MSTGGLPTVTAVPVTLPSPTGAGNTLVACITAGGSVTAPGISGVTLGGLADNWQAAVTDTSNVSIFGGAIWYDPDCAAGQTSVVITLTGGTGTGGDSYVAVYEVAGILTADQFSHGDSGSPAATWSSGATPVTAQADEIFFGACTASNAIPAVTGAGTWVTQSTGAGTWDQVAGYQIVSATGAAAFSGTLPGGGGLYSALVAAFAVPGPGAPVTAFPSAALATAAAQNAAGMVIPAVKGSSIPGGAAGPGSNAAVTGTGGSAVVSQPGQSQPGSVA